jgi:hypothetical protein
MATDASFVTYICEQADMPRRLTFKKMFGEYALYVDGKVSARHPPPARKVPKKRGVKTSGSPSP